MAIKEVIGSTEVQKVEANGKKTTVLLEISKPFAVSDSEWSCYATDPGTQEMEKLSGIDGLQVLSIAMNFIGNRMRGLEAKGIVWLEPTTNCPFPIAPYFFLDTFHRTLESKSDNKDS